MKIGDKERGGTRKQKTIAKRGVRFFTKQQNTGDSRKRRGRELPWVGCVVRKVGRGPEKRTKSHQNSIGGSEQRAKNRKGDVEKNTVTGREYGKGFGKKKKRTAHTSSLVLQSKKTAPRRQPPIAKRWRAEKT